MQQTPEPTAPFNPGFTSQTPLPDPRARIGIWVRLHRPPLRTSERKFLFHSLGTTLLLGITLAYEPALGDGTTWTLPYSGSATVNGGVVFSITNTGGGSDDGAIRGIASGSAGVRGDSRSAPGVMGTSSGFGSSGVSGTASGQFGNGVFGMAPLGYGVYGTSGTPSIDSRGETNSNRLDDFETAGVLGTGYGDTAVGMLGAVYSANPAIAGVNGNRVGVQGYSGKTYGLYGTSNGRNDDEVFASAGVYGNSSTTTGVAGVSGSNSDPAVYGYNSGAGAGAWGQSQQGYGVYGLTNRTEAAGVFGTNSNGGAGVIGLGKSTVSPTGYFRNDTSGNGVGLQGQCSTGTGIFGVGRTGVYGMTTVRNGNAAYFNGNVQVMGTIFGGAKNFKIDHPLDPAHKYLVHASVESSEMLNTYSGNVTLDSDGKAVVEMPAWFEVENGDCRYQLTCIGSYAPVYVERKMQHNQFAIAGGKAGQEVSWQVTAVRQDAYAKHHPLQVEQEKTGQEAGKYLHPEDFGKSRMEGISMNAAAANIRTLNTAHPATRFVTSRPLRVALPVHKASLTPSGAANLHSSGPAHYSH